MKHYAILATLIFGSSLYAQNSSNILTNLKEKVHDINIKIITDSNFLKKLADNTYLTKDINSFSYTLDNIVTYKNIKVKTLSRDYTFDNTILKSTTTNIDFNTNAIVNNHIVLVEGLKLKIPKTKCEELIKIASVDNLKKYAKCRKVEKVHIVSAIGKLDDITFMIDNSVNNILTVDKNRQTLNGTINITITKNNTYNGLLEFINKSVNLKVDADKNFKFTSDEVINIW